MTRVLALRRRCSAPGLDSTCSNNFWSAVDICTFFFVLMIAGHGVYDIFVNFLICKAL